MDKETGSVASFPYIANSTNGEETGGTASLENVSSSSISDEENGGFGPSTITGCSFDGNTATDGGAIYTASGYDRVVNSTFTNNFAGGYYYSLMVFRVPAGDTATCMSISCYITYELSRRATLRHRTLMKLLFFLFALSASQGGALLHSGVLVALTGSFFESNMAGKDGLAVMSLGLAEKIANSSFRKNSFFCASGKYGLTKDIHETEVWLKPRPIAAIWLFYKISLAKKIFLAIFLGLRWYRLLCSNEGQLDNA